MTTVKTTLQRFESIMKDDPEMASKILLSGNMDKWSHPSVCYKEAASGTKRMEEVTDKCTRLSCPKEGWSVRVRNDDFEWSDYEG